MKNRIKDEETVMLADILIFPKATSPWTLYIVHIAEE